MTNHLIWAAAVAAAIVSGGAAQAGQTINEAGVLACVIDTWKETEKEKGHKLVDYAGRCIVIPDDASVPKHTEACSGSYEYMADGSWKGSGGCKDTYPGGDTVSLTWEEGSHLKAYTYTTTGGTGKYKGASGGGTYVSENLSDTLAAGRFQGKMVLP